MKSILNKEIDQLLVSVDFIERKFQKNYYILNNLKFEKKNMIFYRNLYYLDLIIEKIKENFEEINIIKKIIKNKKLKKEVKRTLKYNAKVKALACMILLKELTKMMNNYEFGNFDFEVQTIVSEERDILMSNIPEKYKEKILEEFEEIDFNYNYFLDNEHLLEEFAWTKKAGRALRRAGRAVSRGVRRAGRAVARGVKKVGKAVVSGAKAALNAAKRLAQKVLDAAKSAFNKIKNFATKIFGQIGSFFKKIFDSIKKILGLFKKIGSFIFKTLVGFIKLMWKLLTGLLNFVTKWIPRFIKRTFSFIKYLGIKAKKTWLVTAGLFFLLNVAFTKYWGMLLGNMTIAGEEVETMVPSQLIELPSLFFTTHIFWTQTRALSKIQNTIINTFLKDIKLLKFLFVTILGLPNSTLFTAKMSFKRRITLFGIYIKTNIKTFTVRLLIFIFVLKYLVKFIYINILEEAILDSKDILLFPIVVVRFLLQTGYYVIR